MIFPPTLPATGLGDDAVWHWFAQAIADRSAKLGDPLSLAHMDPPTPELAARLVGLNAQYNQNLLHAALSPFATEAEQCVIAWLAPYFGMRAGHMCAGSTLANLTALWAAREAGARAVVASADAHISVPKSAHILGMAYRAVPTDSGGRIDIAKLGDLHEAALVLTAGTTGRGAIDPLARHAARWLHVDAAWAGPLRLTSYADRLAGIECADSIAISAHKWLYQPKDSALVLFADPDMQSAISYGGSYLATPNIGVQGSRGAAAIPLLATLLAWGQSGLAARIERNMADAQQLADYLAAHDGAQLHQQPVTAVVNWRPRYRAFEAVAAALGPSASRTQINGDLWLRHVAANPHADIPAICARIAAALG
jgi:L-2,4-diaminobutyrate decarboxylase